METLVLDPTNILIRLNEVLSSAIVILAFSLFVYIFAHNLRSTIGRGFAVLLVCVCFTYAGDVALFQVNTLEAAIPWLKFQWIGIAFIPAAYLHFADVLLRVTNAVSSRRRFAVGVAYLFGFVLLLLATQTNHLVRNPFYSPGVTQFRAGSFFWVFTIYFYTTLVWGGYKVYRARARCLTSGAKRRMTYLAASFVAPALGVYPYMLIASASPQMPPAALLITLFLVNLGIAAMIVVMAYSVVFFGALSPERVIKHNLIHFLLRGPLVAALVISIVQALPEQQRLLGLPRDMILAIMIVTAIVLSQLLINLAKPAIDRLIFYQDREEVAWITELDRRLLTTTDLQQALENILIALCEVLRVRTGFIYNLATTTQKPRLETLIGSHQKVEGALTALNVTNLVQENNGHEGYHFVIENNFWFVVLKNEARDRSLGLLGVEARAEAYDLTPVEEETVARLIEQAETALEDRRLQQDIFITLKKIIPDIERVQRLRQAVSYAGASPVAPLLDSPIYEQDFPQMVRDALTHYWGGPKLTRSPLLSLQVVQEALTENDGSAVRALRTVLGQAIEKLRPEGERQMTAAEWLLYNILELKFVQGMRVRDVARRLAVSEADLYRKQRLAIDEVARALREMEAQGRISLTPGSLSNPVEAEQPASSS